MDRYSISLWYHVLFCRVLSSILETLAARAGSVGGDDIYTYIYVYDSLHDGIH